MKRPHPCMTISTRKVIMLLKNGPTADHGHRVEILETGHANPATFLRGNVHLRAYSFFWEHQVTVRTDEGDVSTVVTQPIGPLFTTMQDWPTRQTIAHDTNTPHLLGSDPRPYSFLFAEFPNREVVIQDRPLP